MQYPEIGKIYKHYKGGKYKVLTLASHSETNEKLVIYRSIHFGSIHARPLSMWFEEVPVITKQIVEGKEHEIYGGEKVLRFELIN